MPGPQRKQGLKPRIKQEPKQDIKKTKKAAPVNLADDLLEFSETSLEEPREEIDNPDFDDFDNDDEYIDDTTPEPAGLNRILPIWIWCGDDIVWASKIVNTSNQRDLELFRRLLVFSINLLGNRVGLEHKHPSLLYHFFNKGWLSRLDEEKPSQTPKSGNGKKSKIFSSWIERLDKLALVLAGEKKIVPLKAFIAGQGKEMETLPDIVERKWLEAELIRQGKPLERKSVSADLYGPYEAFFIEIMKEMRRYFNKKDVGDEKASTIGKKTFENRLTKWRKWLEQR